jgi:high-affinity K+ transport system ATPase subunit B
LMKLPPSADAARETRSDGPVRRALRTLLLGVTLLFVVAALAVSSTLVVYTAWLHDLRNGLFALLFAVLSAQIALSWLLWKDDEEEE